MNEIITKNKQKLIALFKKNKVKKAYVFGSVLNSSFNENSDIDLIIDFESNLQPLEKGELWWNLYEDLKKLFNKEVDIINESKIKNPYFLQEINSTKELIYG
jgi:predicted nucleotidyltransferase